LLHLLAALGVLAGYHVALHALHVRQQVEISVHLVLGVLKQEQTLMLHADKIVLSQETLRQLVDSHAQIRAARLTAILALKFIDKVECNLEKLDGGTVVTQDGFLS
jgi:hypothetical protein